MEKTSIYNLNKPEAADPMRLSDFNENADKIDAALGTLNTAVAAGIKMQTGTYKGKGTYDSANPNTLTLDFPPKFLLIWGTIAHLAKGIPSANLMVQFDYSAWSCPTTWNGKTVTWYNTSGAQQQMNESGKTYYYLALG